jgi:hypothetical protein
MGHCLTTRRRMDSRRTVESGSGGPAGCHNEYCGRWSSIFDTYPCLWHTRELLCAPCRLRRSHMPGAVRGGAARNPSESDPGRPWRLAGVVLVATCGGRIGTIDIHIGVLSKTIIMTVVVRHRSFLAERKLGVSLFMLRATQTGMRPKSSRCPFFRGVSTPRALTRALTPAVQGGAKNCGSWMVGRLEGWKIEIPRARHGRFTPAARNGFLKHHLM